MQINWQKYDTDSGWRGWYALRLLLVNELENHAFLEQPCWWDALFRVLPVDQLFTAAGTLTFSDWLSLHHLTLADVRQRQPGFIHHFGRWLVAEQLRLASEVKPILQPWADRVVQAGLSRQANALLHFALHLERYKGAHFAGIAPFDKNLAHFFRIVGEIIGEDGLLQVAEQELAGLLAINPLAQSLDSLLVCQPGLTRPVKRCVPPAPRQKPAVPIARVVRLTPLVAFLSGWKTSGPLPDIPLLAAPGMACLMQQVA